MNFFTPTPCPVSSFFLDLFFCAPCGKICAKFSRTIFKKRVSRYAANKPHAPAYPALQKAGSASPAQSAAPACSRNIRAARPLPTLLRSSEQQHLPRRPHTPHFRHIPPPARSLPTDRPGGTAWTPQEPTACACEIHKARSLSCSGPFCASCLCVHMNMRAADCAQ